MEIKYKNKKVLAIIPARGGSKGLFRKNIKSFVGKPLISWTIKEALKSKYLNRIVVSTEDEDISIISKKHGSEVIERPKKLAKDSSSIHEVVEHVINYLENKEKYIPDIIVLLQPTSPLRTVKDIDEAIRLFLTSKCKSVISVCESSHPIHWFMKAKKQYVEPILGLDYLKKRRQELPLSYIPNGAIYISNTKNFLKNKTFYSDKILHYIMSAEKSVDINNEIEFKLAEMLIKKNEQNKNRK